MFNRDPLGCLADVSDAICFADEEGGAFQLAKALGACKVFGVRVRSRRKRQLTVQRAQRAMEELVGVVQDGVRRARSLERDFDQAPDTFVGELFCTEVLEARQDVWLAFEAINEVVSNFLEEKPADVVYAFKLDLLRENLMDLMDGFDDALEGILGLLATALPAFENYRRCLSEEFQDLPPWWLDGQTIEGAAL